VNQQSVSRAWSRWVVRAHEWKAKYRLSPVWALRVAFGTAALFSLFIFVRHAVEASRVVDGVRYFWLDDDQMISMRYARNLAEGAGLVWNEGEYVEGYSNFLWTLVMSLVHLLGAPDATASLYVQGIAWLLTLFTLRCTVDILQTLGARSYVVIGSVLLTIVCCTDVMYWATSGFSTPLSTALHVFVVARVLRTAKSGGADLGRVGMVALALLPLVRGDTVVLWGADALLYFALARGRMRAVGVAALTLLPMVAHLAFRLGYYGDWFPNTYYLKVTGRSDRAALGIRYITQFSQRYPTLLAMAAGVALVLLRRRDWLGIALPLAIVPIYAYAVTAGGDNFRPFRFFSPSMPIVIAFAGVGAARLISGGSTAKLAWCAVLFVAVVPVREPLGNIAKVGQNGKPPKHLISAIWLRKNADPAASVAVVPAGIVPYFSRLRALDVLGKSDRHIARLPQNKGAGIGHGKIDPEYTLGQAPDYVVSCRAKKFASDAPKNAKKDKKKLKRDYVLNLLSSKPFQKSYVRNSVKMKYLEKKNAIFVHAESPEWQRRKSWKSVRLDR